MAEQAQEARQNKRGGSGRRGPLKTRGEGRCITTGIGLRRVVSARGNRVRAVRVDEGPSTKIDLVPMTRAIVGRQGKVVVDDGARNGETDGGQVEKIGRTDAGGEA